MHLLKYGPKTPSPLAKSVKTYREDVRRTLTYLIEKGMVRPSLDAPTSYAAVDLDTALDAALKTQKSAFHRDAARCAIEGTALRPSKEVLTPFAETS